MQKTNLVRAIQLAALSNGNLVQAHAAAIAKYGEASGAARFVKSLASISTDIQDADLMQAFQDLLDLARPSSLISKINAVSRFKRVPFHIRVLVQNDGSPANYVDETGVIPLGSLNLQGVTLPKRKAAGIIPSSRELVSLMDGSTAAAEADIVTTIAGLDSSAFFNDAPGSDYTPAGILHGTLPGEGSNNASNDVQTLIARFSGNLDGAVLLTSPANGAKLNATFEGSGARGGETAGIAHVTHRAIPNDRIALVEPGRTLFSDGGLAIDVSKQSTLYEMDSSGAVARSISLWQANCIALRVIRWLNWQPAQGAVAWLEGVDW